MVPQWGFRNIYLIILDSSWCAQTLNSNPKIRRKGPHRSHFYHCVYKNSYLLHHHSACIPTSVLSNILLSRDHILLEAKCCGGAHSNSEHVLPFPEPWEKNIYLLCKSAAISSCIKWKILIFGFFQPSASNSLFTIYMVRRQYHGKICHYPNGK